jgi:hypothetical protein
MAATFTAAAAAATTVMLATNPDSKTLLSSSTYTTKLEAAHECAALKEPATGILFDALCNGYTLVGTGVRVKYGLIKVYAVGTYIDSNAVANIKNDSAAIEAALLNVNVPRTIRIVMDRNLGIQKYTEAIVEALTPRMHGQDLDKLDEFKRLNPPIDLEKGTRALVLSREFQCVRWARCFAPKYLTRQLLFSLSRTLAHVVCMCACISLRARPRCMPCMNI